MYRYENDQLFKLNFAVFAAEALTNQNPDRYKLLYLEQKYQEKQKLLTMASNKNRNIDSQGSSNLFAYTLYIGFYKNNLYALPALIYNWQIPGIEGPTNPRPTPLLPMPTDPVNPSTIETGLSNPTIPNKEQATNTLAIKETIKNKNKHAIKIGHHKYPDKFKPPPNYIQINTKLPFFDSVKEESGPKDGDDDNQDFLEIIGVSVNGDESMPKQPVCVLNVDEKSMSGPIKKASLSLWKKFDQLMQNKYFFMLFTLLIGSLIIMLKNAYDERKKREKKNLKKQIKEELTKKGYDVSNSSSSSISSSIADEDREDSRSTQINLGSNADQNENSNKPSSSKKSSKGTLKKPNKSTSNEDETKVENLSGKDRRNEPSNVPEVDEKGHIKIGKIKKGQNKNHPKKTKNSKKYKIFPNFFTLKKY
jgi:hypothetical protein